jgi:hypothetical protein
MRAIDGFKATALATDGAAFTLHGGKYLLTAHANSGSALTASLQKLSADGTNYVIVSSAFAHVDGSAALDLPPGQYRFHVSGTPGSGETFDMDIGRVPGE